jgi:hypothetical protein
MTEPGDARGWRPLAAEGVILKNHKDLRRKGEATDKASELGLSLGRIWAS